MADGTAAPTSAKRVGRPPKARGAANTSDAADARWTVRGVPMNVRTMATKAAENRGMTVGDWLAEAIVAHARSAKPGVSSDTDGVSADATASVPALLVSDQLEKMLSDIQERLAKIEGEKQKSFFVRLFGRQV